MKFDQYLGHPRVISNYEGGFINDQMSGYGSLKKNMDDDRYLEYSGYFEFNSFNGKGKM